MNEPDSHPANAEVVAPPPASERSSQPASARQPFVRGRLAVCAIFIVVLAGGYYGGHFVRSRYLHRAAGGDALAGEKDAQVASFTPPVLPPLVFDPDAPLPTTAEALYQETLGAIDALVRRFPEHADALEMKARVQMWLGNSSQAEETWQQCLKLDPKYVHAYIGMASAAAARADHDKSLELAQQALTLDPRNFQARASIADALLQLGRAQEVPGVLEEHLSQDPRSRGHYLLGQAYAQTGNAAQARDHFEAAIRIFPDYVEAYNALAVAYDKLGEADKAKQAMDKFRALGTQQADDPLRVREDSSSDLAALQREASVLYTDAGRVLYVGKKSREAEQFWLRAAALDSQNVPCRQSLAWLCHNARREGENIAWLKQLAELEPANPSYWTEIGRVYMDLMLVPAAEESYRQACQVAPESDIGYAALADLLLRSEQKLPETLELARKAVQYRPSAPHYAMLAAACRANQDLAGARTAIEQALKLAPHNEAFLAEREAIEADLQEKQ